MTEPAGGNPVLWTPTPERARSARIVEFARMAEARFGAPRALDPEGLLGPEGYRALHAWSVSEPDGFWRAVWVFTGIVSGDAKGADLSAGSAPGAAPHRGVVPPEAPPPPGFPPGGFDPGHRPRWFPDARLNFAENLLAPADRDSEAPALVSWDEGGRRATLTFGELRHEAARFAEALRARGIGPGDRVAGFMPNVAETIVAFLGTAAVGAVWSSCSPDFGTGAVVDRFGQIEPRLLVAADGYRYKGKAIDLASRVAEIAGRLPSVEAVVVVPFAPGGSAARGAPAPDARGAAGGGPDTAPGGSGGPGAVAWEAFLRAGGPPADGGEALRIPEYARLPFDHPLAILYSSGTTGLPKCIVHTAGGTLLQHRKEHALHVDLRAGERFFYFTTCGWMMWNWLVTGLAEGAALVLYDGAPALPDEPDVLWRLAEAEGVSVFGVSAKYLALMEKEGVRPGAERELSGLRCVLSTGSPLAPASFEWVYGKVKADVHLASISGGTDLVSCFVLGVPTLPVRRGEIQGAGLGMAVEVRAPGAGSVAASGAEGATRLVGEPGELVCVRPFPSMPREFWNDPGHARYRAAYFEEVPGVWRHGDWAEETPQGGYVIHGRSDATLNPGGVRIGTAEIYRQVEAFPEVLESVAVGQEVPGGSGEGDVRIVLFVRMREGAVLDDALEAGIRRRIREHASPHHVPRVILSVGDIPRTISGKISEIAVREVIHGRAVKNTDALANPEALEHFRGVVGLHLPAPLEALLRGVVDYAGLFPPSSLPMSEAVTNHASYRASNDRWALGRFVVPVARLDEFQEAVAPHLETVAPWELSALVGDDPGSDAHRVAAFHRWAERRARVAAIEARAGDAARVAAVTTAFPPHPPGETAPGLEVWLEVPWGLVPEWTGPGAGSDAELRALLRAIHGVGAFAKARTGGVTPDLFPSPERLLAFLRAAVDEGVRFKATAGLHHPLRGRYPLTYAPDAPKGVMFGYLNVLLATAVLRAGGSDAEGLAALVEPDPAALSFGAEALGWGRFRFDAKELADLRNRTLGGFGSCSLREPVDELGGVLSVRRAPI
jgi:acetoacetyl-CoA synthetase